MVQSRFSLPDPRPKTLDPLSIPSFWTCFSIPTGFPKTSHSVILNLIQNLDALLLNVSNELTSLPLEKGLLSSSCNLHLAIVLFWERRTAQRSTSFSCSYELATRYHRPWFVISPDPGSSPGWQCYLIAKTSHHVIWTCFSIPIPDCGPTKPCIPKITIVFLAFVLATWNLHLGTDPLLLRTRYLLPPTTVSHKPRSRIKSGMTVLGDCEYVTSRNAELVSASLSQIVVPPNLVFQRLQSFFWLLFLQLGTCILELILCSYELATCYHRPRVLISPDPGSSPGWRPH